MKLTVAILFALVAVSVGQISKLQKAETKLIFAYCLVRERASLAGAEDLVYGELESKNIDHKTKCFTNCVLEKVGFLVDGEVQPERMSKLLAPIVGEEKFKSGQAICNNVKGADNCETAFLVFQCFHNAVGPLPRKTERKPDNKIVAGIKQIQGLLSSL